MATTFETKCLKTELRRKEQKKSGQKSERKFEKEEKQQMR